MAPWSNMEMNVGILAEKWPKNELSYWVALHQAVDSLRQTMRHVNDRMGALENDADLSDRGKARIRADVAKEVLQTLDDFPPLKKASNTVARRIDNLRQRITVLPDAPTSAADLNLATEIRNLVRSQ